jgi:TonB family protein
VRTKTDILAIAVVLLLVGVMCPQQNQTNPTLDSQRAASSGSQTLKVVHREAPVYPQEAKAKDIRDTLVVEAVVDKQGNVIKAKVGEGDKIFWDAALTALKAWKFQPATAQGQPAQKAVQIKISFCGKHGEIGRGCQAG